jgi:hypothetical protein
MDIKSICQQLNKQTYVENHLVPPPSQKYEKFDEKQQNEILIKKDDLIALQHFVQIWTDVLEIDEAQEQFAKSEYSDLLTFEYENYLFNLGFFYVKINKGCSPAEFLSFLDKVPFDQFCTPGTNQISYSTLTHLFGKDTEKFIIQLMVLGDFFKYWVLINPYSKLKHTPENTKLFLSGTSLSVVISPSYIRNCVELIKNFEVISAKQTESGQYLLY